MQHYLGNMAIDDRLHRNADCSLCAPSRCHTCTFLLALSGIERRHPRYCLVCRFLWSLPCKAGRGQKTIGEAIEGVEAEVGVGMVEVGVEATGVTGAEEVNCLDNHTLSVVC